MPRSHAPWLIKPRGDLSLVVDVQLQLSQSIPAALLSDFWIFVFQATCALILAAQTLPNGRGAQGHHSLPEGSSETASLENIHGKLSIHHGRQYTVMTNSPNFDQQLALNSYWQSIGGLAFLPGTIRAADRFARASFFLTALPRRLDPAYSSALSDHTFSHQALASVLSLMRGVSVPLGISTAGQPNLSSTIWRVVSAQNRRVLLFDSVTSPSVFWVSLDQLDLTSGAPVRRLQLAGGQVYAGETAAKFQPAAPFPFAPASGLPGLAPKAAGR